MSEFLMPVLEGQDSGEIVLTTSNGWEVKHSGGLAHILEHKASGYELVIMVCSLCTDANVMVMMGMPLSNEIIFAEDWLSNKDDDFEETLDTVGKQLTYTLNSLMNDLQCRYDNLE